VLYLEKIGRFSTDLIYLEIAAIIMIVDSFVITLYGYLRGIEHLEYESLGIIIHRVVIMIIGITTLSLGAPPIWSLFAVLSGTTANLCFVTWQFWKRRINWRPIWPGAQIKRLLRVSLPFAVAALFIAIYSSSDNILLQMFAGRRSVGLYGTAAKIIAGFNQIFPAALIAAIFPAMSASFISDRERLRNIFRDAMTYLMVVAIPLMVVLFILAKPIVIAGWGIVWADAIWPLRVLSIGIPFLFLNYPVGYLLNAANMQTRNTINVAIVVVTNIAANLIFVDQFGYRSVAIISVASSALLFFLGLIPVRKVIAIPVKELAKVLVKTLATGGLVAVIGWILLPTTHKTTSAAGVAFVMAAVYVLAMFAFKLIRWEQISHIIRRFRRA
jgi:O-antigen/teichoic acid export membrane protein